jgi:hypothetical protein
LVEITPVLTARRPFRRPAVTTGATSTVSSLLSVVSISESSSSESSSFESSESSSYDELSLSSDSDIWAFTFYSTKDSSGRIAGNIYVKCSPFFIASNF